MNTCAYMTSSKPITCYSHAGELLKSVNSCMVTSFNPPKFQIPGSIKLLLPKICQANQLRPITLQPIGLRPRAPSPDPTLSRHYPSLPKPTNYPIPRQAKF